MLTPDRTRGHGHGKSLCSQEMPPALQSPSHGRIWGPVATAETVPSWAVPLPRPTPLASGEIRAADSLGDGTAKQSRSCHSPGRPRGLREMQEITTYCTRPLRTDRNPAETSTKAPQVQVTLHPDGPQVPSASPLVPGRRSWTHRRSSPSSCPTPLSPSTRAPRHRGLLLVFLNSYLLQETAVSQVPP